MTPASAAPIWALTTGEAGMISQAAGLAAAIGPDWCLKTIGLRRPWRWVPGHRCPMALHGLTPGSDAVRPPWPRLVISCGRRSVPVALAIRKAAEGRTRAVHIQDPRVPLDRFDLVIVPRHDAVTGANVWPSRGALHRITPADLTAAADRFGPRLASLPRPLVAVLIGGTSKAYRMTGDDARRIANQLRTMAHRTGAGLAVTLSRRTGAANAVILRQALADLPGFVWAGEGENPYLGMLALADHIVVTADSASMVSEAASTGRPVHILGLTGGNARFERFHGRLAEDGVTRPFDPTLPTWTYRPLSDTAEAANRIRALWPDLVGG